MKVDHRIAHKIGTQRVTIDKETTLNDLIGIIVRVSKKYRSNTAKHQKQINQVQTTEEINSVPLVWIIQKVLNGKLKHINCESTDNESDTENTILFNMIKVEIDYETATYEQSFFSHVYGNQLELLRGHYTRPRSNNIPIEQEVKEAMAKNEPEKERVPCSSTNHFYQNAPKEPPIKTFLVKFMSLRESKK